MRDGRKKGLRFLLKNRHFLLKNLDFLIKNLHFLYKNRGGKSGARYRDRSCPAGAAGRDAGAHVSVW